MASLEVAVVVSPAVAACLLVVCLPVLCRPGGEIMVEAPGMMPGAQGTPAAGQAVGAGQSFDTTTPVPGCTHLNA